MTRINKFPIVVLNSATCNTLEADIGRSKRLILSEMDFLFILTFYFSYLRVTEACEITTYEFVTTILHPKSDAGFLTSRTCKRAECASDCFWTTNCWKFYHNPTDNTCFLASRTQMVVPDTSFSNTTENIFDMLRKSGKLCYSLLENGDSQFCSMPVTTYSKIHSSWVCRHWNHQRKVLLFELCKNILIS